MGLDVRWPIGLLFTVLGILLAGYGLVTGRGGIDLWWGLCLLAFGLTCVALARRGDALKRQAPRS